MGNGVSAQSAQITTQGKGKEKCTEEWYLRETAVLQLMYLRLPTHLDMQFERRYGPSRLVWPRSTAELSLSRGLPFYGWRADPG